MKASTQNSKKSKKIIFISIIIIFFILIFGSLQYYKYLKGPVDLDNYQDITIEIPKGSSTNKIAHILKKNELIKNELIFKLLSKQKNVDALFKAGNYRLNKAMNTEQIIESLINGSVFVETAKFTIPEGFELKQIVERLVNHPDLNIDQDKFMDLVENEEFDFKFLKDIPKSKNRLEGFLFPDTYEVEKNASEKDIILKMLNRFDDIFKEEYYDRAKDIDMSVKDIIVLASIIEREAKVNKERPIISSVFHNRLKKGKLLQSCATVQYVLGERKENLTYKDLEIDSPYNTYKNQGLPPMPIASPGKAAIEAALFPADTDFLYFVAKGDGSHVFSKTYSDHLKAKNRN